MYMADISHSKYDDSCSNICTMYGRYIPPKIRCKPANHFGWDICCLDHVCCLSHMYCYAGDSFGWDISAYAVCAAMPVIFLGGMYAA
jgi:hypothetical protein